MIRPQDLEGRWHLVRRVQDLRNTMTGRLEGQAMWVPTGAPGELCQEEQGVLVMEGQPPMHATRRYLWHWPEEAGAEARQAQIDVLFEDGRPFHSFDATKARPEAQHFCDPDHYDVSYDFSAWPVWSSTWRVRGPRKEAVIESVFTRD